MPISFTCPHCGAQTDVAPRYAGQTGPCASCGRTITVPLGSGPRSADGQPVQGSFWPKVIGTLSIVLGSFGLASILLNVFNPAQKQILEKLPAWFSTYTTFGMLVGVAITVLLLTAGILLFKRRPAGRTLHVAYGLIAVVTAIIGAVVNLSVDTSRLPEMFRLIFLAAALGGGAFGMAYPGFLLVWFFRRKIRDQVAGWADEQPPSPTG